MRTNIYIDGFNLYYGSLKGTKYKWLDLRALFTRILRPENEIRAIKYYTAKVTARPDDPSAPTRQQFYLDALKTQGIKITLGHFLESTVRMRLAKPGPFSKTAEVIKTEEKGSDVNLALDLLNDAWCGVYDVAVVCSNDSDLRNALQLVKTHGKKIVLVVPGDPALRPTAIQLKRFADAEIRIKVATWRRVSSLLLFREPRFGNRRTGHDQPSFRCFLAFFPLRVTLISVTPG